MTRPDHAPRCACCAELARLRAGMAAGNHARRTPCSVCGSTAQRNRRRMEGGTWTWYCPACEPPRRPRGRPQ